MWNEIGWNESSYYFVYKFLRVLESDFVRITGSFKALIPNYEASSMDQNKNAYSNDFSRNASSRSYSPPKFEKITFFCTFFDLIRASKQEQTNSKGTLEAPNLWKSKTNVSQKLLPITGHYVLWRRFVSEEIETKIGGVFFLKGETLGRFYKIGKVACIT